MHRFLLPLSEQAAGGGWRGLLIPFLIAVFVESIEKFGMTCLASPGRCFVL